MDQQEIFKEALAMQEELTTWRHALHQMPELSLDLPKTSAFVQTRFAEMDVPFHTIVKGNGVVAQLGEGEPCLLLRADMDALPVAETSGVDFASTNGCMPVATICTRPRCSARQSFSRRTKLSSVEP